MYIFFVLFFCWPCPWPYYIFFSYYLTFIYLIASFSSFLFLLFPLSIIFILIIFLKVFLSIIFPTDHNINQIISIYSTCTNTNFFFLLQALNGFLVILACEGEVFFATHNIESYLGFHQVSPSTCILTCPCGVPLITFKRLDVHYLSQQFSSLVTFTQTEPQLPVLTYPCGLPLVTFTQTWPPLTVLLFLGHLQVARSSYLLYLRSYCLSI